ncbi:MAG: hypothetical protein M1358_14865 [Chloroflexi bacterium]|nr:hypothetical protein [Chloroflexota bacterium]
MRGLTQGVRTILTVTRFFAMLYGTFFCTYLAPTHDLRRWGTTTSWRLIQFGLARPVEVIRIDSTAELRDDPPIPAIGVPVAGAWAGQLKLDGPQI